MRQLGEADREISPAARRDNGRWSGLRAWRSSPAPPRRSRPPATRRDQLVDRQDPRAARLPAPTAGRRAHGSGRGTAASGRAPTGRRPPRRRTAAASSRRGSRADAAGIARCRHCRRSSRSTACRRTALSAREQRLKRRLALLHQVQHRAPRRARAEAGQARQRLGQRFDLGAMPWRRQIGRMAARASQRHRRGHADHLHGHARISPCRRSTRWSRRGTRSPRPTPSRPARRAAARRARRRRSQQRAEALGIEVRTPGLAAKGEAQQAAFAALEADVAVVAAYGLILPQPILDAPRSAASTSTPRCCRAGAGRRRSSGRSSPATTRPASRSCGWSAGSTPGRCCRARACRVEDKTAGATARTSWPRSARG